MFGKFFAQAFTGSMFGAGANVFAVWSYAIANQKTNHTVELNPDMLAAVIGMKPEEAEAAIEFLCSPDPRSRTQDKEGRRLLNDGGFCYTLVNGGQYQNIRNEQERREYLRIKKAESRARLAARQPGEEG